jgi:hypothetical protein
LFASPPRPGTRQRKWPKRARRGLARGAEAFSSQVESLGGSENAIKQGSIFKPSGITWRLGKCDQTSEHFQAKWNHLAARKMRSNKGAFSSQVESLGGSENATKQRFGVLPVNVCERETR